VANNKFIVLIAFLLKNQLFATQRAVFWFVAVENDAFECVETFCYTI